MDKLKNETSLWKFSQIPNIEESNFNKILERFYGLGVAGLTRENIQNSLDGRLVSNDEPVEVNIELGKIAVKDVPGLVTVAEHVHSLEGRNSYTKETIQHMQASLNSEEVSYISFEDCNTKGLTGAKYGQSNDKAHTWGIYAYNKGVHFEEENSTFEASRGGSHGVGKIASNAASDLHLMYFANCDEFGEQHLGGTIQLIEHKYKQNFYRSTGYFASLDEVSNPPKYMPIVNDFNEVFKKENRGLKIIIPFLRDSFDKEVEVVRAVCDNFFISIIEKKLIVKINGKVIDEQTIKSIVKNEKYYIQDISEMKKEFTTLYVNTYFESEPQTIQVTNGQQQFNFKLFFNYDENIPKGRVAIVRTIGMKIEDFTVKNNATKPFNAILIGGVDEDSYLKSLENESHTKISNEDIKDPKLKRMAKKFINSLNAEIVKVIEAEIRKNNPVDGKINTNELLYTMEIDFKENLAKKFGAVKIQNGKSFVTVEDEPNKKDKIKEKRKSPETEQEPKEKSPVKKERKKLTKIKTGEKEVLIDAREDSYKINPYQVERLIIGDTEMIHLDLSGSEEIQSAKDCNLKVIVIDGMGNEYPDEINLEKSYSSIVDLNNDSKECQVKNGVVQNIRFNKGTIKLKFELNKSYNRSLKYIYYVEV